MVNSCSGEIVMGKDFPYGICSVYCGQCASGNHRIQIIALEYHLRIFTG
ncbi:MAG: hypothetical protein ACTSYM_06395 [Candidatus Baldrarchaeia archaeon]